MINDLFEPPPRLRDTLMAILGDIVNAVALRVRAFMSR